MKQETIMRRRARRRRGDWTLHLAAAMWIGEEKPRLSLTGRLALLLVAASASQPSPGWVSIVRRPERAFHKLSPYEARR